MQRFVRLSSFCLLAGAFQATLFAQAAAEAAVVGSAAAIGTAGAAKVSKSINGLGSAISGALNGAQAGDAGPAGSTVVQTLRATTTKGTKLAAPKPDAKLEDAAAIEAGMTNEELMRRFGPPNLQITDGPAISLLYSSKSGRVRVEMRDGKVASVDKPKS